MDPSLQEVLEFALTLSSAAGRFILALWKNTPVDHKADGTEVTEADRGAEQLLRRLIAERYPEHSILGEEGGGDWDRDAEHLWILDPVDGTSSFALGLPVFGTLIGYVRRGEPCAGVIGGHALGETVYAANGVGCWLSRDGDTPVRIRTSAVTDPGEALIAGTIAHTDLDPVSPNPSISASRLCKRARRLRWSGDCINYALVCQGRIDVAFDSRMKPWDIAALAPCVREAGGVITSVTGNEEVVWQPDVVASANAELHARILSLLRPASSAPPGR